VETSKNNQTTNLLIEIPRNIRSSIEPHQQLNYSQGVVSCWNLQEVPEEVIKNELASQGVVNVRQIKTKKSRELQPTGYLILTFTLLELPKDVKATFYCLCVRPYIPSPLRCFKFPLYGHTSKSCNVATAACVICNTSSHGGGPCTLLNAQCVNCNGEQKTWSRDCPIFKEEE